MRSLLPRAACGGVADPNDAASGGPAFELAWPVGWTDYLGGPSGDGVVDFNGNPGSPVWTFDSHTAYMQSLYGEIDSSDGDATVYHGDMIGSTMITSRLESDPPGQESVEAVSAVAYTAFGETVTLTGAPDPNDANVTIWNASIGGELPEGFPRYAYAGQHGYESGLLSRSGANPNLPPITLQHLGWRWYDPSIGRFVQRDPIGIAGGMNVYTYVANSPTASIDPQGLYHWDGLDPPWGYHRPSPSPPPASRRGLRQGAPHNGCTGVGGTFLGGTDFSPACNIHDAAYGTRGYPKSQADDEFLSDMLDLCVTPWDVCRAMTYCIGVRLWGVPYYDSAQLYPE